MEALKVDELRAAAISASKVYRNEMKDIPAYVLMARTLFHAAQGLAAQYPEQAVGYTNISVFTSFNIAAACWPGWEDASPDVTDEMLALSLEMCHYCVETAAALDMPPGRRSNGQWILGAHLLANGDYEGARASFTKGMEFSDQAGSADGKLMAQGWTLVCDILSGDTDKREELDHLSTELAAMGEDGEFYASQFEPAIKAFS